MKYFKVAYIKAFYTGEDFETDLCEDFCRCESTSDLNNFLNNDESIVCIENIAILTKEEFDNQIIPTPDLSDLVYYLPF